MKWLSLLILPFFLSASEPFFVSFEPPKGWLIADPSQYQEGMKIGFIASKKKIFSPSMTLTLENIGPNTDLNTYIKAMRKNFSVDRFNRFQELGSFQTRSGTGILIQVDLKNHFGQIRLLQGVTIHKGYAIIHSAAIPKDQFLTMHEAILTAFKSLIIFPTVAASCKHPDIEERINQVTHAWKTYRAHSKNTSEKLFKEPLFQKKEWKPFVNYVENTLKFKGSCWQMLAIKHIKETLLTENDP